MLFNFLYDHNDAMRSSRNLKRATEYPSFVEISKQPVSFFSDGIQWLWVDQRSVAFIFVVSRIIPVRRLSSEMITKRFVMPEFSYPR